MIVSNLVRSWLLLIVCFFLSPLCVAGNSYFVPLDEDGRSAYEFLGVDSTANDKQIKIARNQMIKDIDINNDKNKSFFQKVNEAFSLIKNQEARESYNENVRTGGQQESRMRTSDFTVKMNGEVAESVNSSELKEFLKERIVGTGTVNVINFNDFDKEVIPEARIVQEWLKAAFSKQMVGDIRGNPGIPEWEPIARRVTDKDFLEKVHFVILPPGVQYAHATAYAFWARPSSVREYSTYYSGADIEDSHKSSLKSVIKSRKEFLAKYSNKFLSQYFIVVHPTMLAQASQSLGVNIGLSTIMHELTHVYDGEIIRNWLEANRQFKLAGMKTSPLFDLVAKVHNGEVYLSQNFLSTFMEVRGHSISNIVDHMLEPERAKKHLFESMRGTLVYTRQGLGVENIDALTMMNMNFVQFNTNGTVDELLSRYRQLAFSGYGGVEHMLKDINMLQAIKRGDVDPYNQGRSTESAIGFCRRLFSK